MAYNGILMNGLLIELKEKLIGGRINKIYQPDDKKLTFTIRNNGENHILYMSAEENFPYVSLLNNKKNNPIKPPNFCMLLRKYLQNGFIVDIKQLELERIFVFSITATDEMGYKKTLRLVVEIMGKHSNIVLINEDNQIYDSIKRVNPLMSKVRTIMPNQPFKFIEFDKVDIRKLSQKLYKKGIKKYTNEKIYRFIYIYFQGFGPTLAKEICNRMNISFDRRISDLSAKEKEQFYYQLERFKNIIDSQRYHPVLYIDNITGEVEEYSLIPLETYESENYLAVEKNIPSKIINEFFDKKVIQNKIKQKSGNLKTPIKNRLNLLDNKIHKLKRELQIAKGAKSYQLKGELLTANIYKLNKGMKEITVQNYHENNKEITIELKANKTPSENAQWYYKKYNKLKKAQIKVSEHLMEATEEFNYLENVLNSINQADDLETLADIREELINEGLLKKKQQRKKKKKKIEDDFRTYKSSDGYTIYAGKNNKQNDYLTLKFANNNDLWFHTKDLAGTHVVIKVKADPVPQQTLDEAAIIAAFHSKGRMSSNVPVDYTRIKNVSKPSGAKLGMVIYVDNSTLYVTPERKLIEKLKADNTQ